MRQDFRIAGSGGQGVILLSVILANAYGMYEGMEVTQTQSYGPEARGGACRAELVVSDKDIDYVKVNEVSVFIAFNEVGFKKYANDILPDTIVFADSTFLSNELLAEYPGQKYSIDATRIAEELFKPFTANIVMLGFVSAKLGNLSYDAVEKALVDTVPAKALKVNMEALRYGYEKGAV